MLGSVEALHIHQHLYSENCSRKQAIYYYPNSMNEEKSTKSGEKGNLPLHFIIILTI